MSNVNLKKHREALVDLESYLIKHKIKVKISRREANSWNIIKKRGINIIFLKTKDHYMEFMFPVDMGLVCIDKVKIFNINEGPSSKKEFETYNKFPTLGDDGSKLFSENVRCWLPM